MGEPTYEIHTLQKKQVSTLSQLWYIEFTISLLYKSVTMGFWGPPKNALSLINYSVPSAIIHPNPIKTKKQKKYIIDIHFLNWNVSKYIILKWSLIQKISNFFVSTILILINIKKIRSVLVQKLYQSLDFSQ